MLRTELIRKLIPLQRAFVRNKTESVAIDIEKLEKDVSALDVIDEDLKAREEEIERKRNKSRLKSQHYNILHDRVPQNYKTPQMWFHGTLQYNRKMYGRYGEASGVDPALCWPTKQELEERIEYESFLHPYTIPEMIQMAKQKRQEEEERVWARQREIIKKMEKLEQWKRDLHNKVAKKEAAALAAKERRDRLVEEVRRHFGYTVDPRDEKFKEMLEKKEKEQKKAMKAAKKKEKEERMLSSLLAKNTEPVKSKAPQSKPEATEQDK